MEVFSPPINGRDNDELIDILISPKGCWQENAIIQAKIELLKRGYLEEELNNLYCEYKEILVKENLNEQKIRNQNSKESYSLIKMVFIFFGSPFIILPGLTLYIFDNFGKSVSELKRENYKIKYKQRLFLLIFGALFWIIIVRIILKL